MTHEARRPHARSRDAGGISTAGIASSSGRREALRGGEVARDESHLDLPVVEGGLWSRQRSARAGVAAGHRAPEQADAGAAGAGISLDQWQGSAAIRFGLRVVDPANRSYADRAEVRG